MMRRFRSFSQIGGKRGGIPSGWVEVEYLESTGTPFINIPFGFDPTDTIDSTFSVDTSEMVDKYIVAPSVWNPNNNRFAVGVHNRNYTCAFGNVSTGFTVMVPPRTNDGLLHHWTYANRIFTVADLALAYDATNDLFGDTTANLKLFYGYNTRTKGKVARYRHIKAGGIGIDLVPVRDAVTNEGAMCDVLTGDIYRNRGTGAFVVGPDKAAWVNPYVTDGLISMYDGEWNAGGGVHAQSGCVDLIGCFGDIVTDIVSDKSVLFSTQDVVQNGTEFTSALENCNTDGMTIELVYTMDTSVMPNRNSLPSFIRIANNNIFSYGQYCAVDSHPAYATCQERMSIRAKSYSGSSYSNIANGETVKITAVKTADTLNMYFNGVEKLSTSALPTYAVPAVGYVTFNYGWKSPVNSFRLYNRALTPAEIAANFAVDRARFNIA